MTVVHDGNAARCQRVVLGFKWKDRIFLLLPDLHSFLADSVAPCAARPGLHGSPAGFWQRSTRGLAPPSGGPYSIMLLLSVEVRAGIISCGRIRTFLSQDLVDTWMPSSRSARSQGILAFFFINPWTRPPPGCSYRKRGILGGTCLNVGCIPSKPCSTTRASTTKHSTIFRKRGIDGSCCPSSTMPPLT